MTYDELIEKITEINNTQGITMSALPHCSNLLFQLQKRVDKNRELFNDVVEAYINMRNVDMTLELSDYVEKMVSATNAYMSIFWPPKNNPFSHQADFGSSIIPEMLCLIFVHIIRKKEVGLEVTAQKDLTIECIFDFTNGGNVRFKNKKVDVAVVKNCILRLDEQEKILPIPLIAIECKTNLDKNMLSGIEFSVGELKKTFPECHYLVVTELSDFDVKKSNYASSGIDEIYVLRKQKRAETRREPHPRNLISTELILEIANTLEKGIAEITEESETLNEKMRSGKLIGR